MPSYSEKLFPIYVTYLTLDISTDLAKMSTSQPKKFTRAEVEQHVESLNHLLKDVGPEISKALTQLVLNKPAASKQEALEFLATHLAASSAPVRLWLDGEK